MASKKRETHFFRPSVERFENREMPGEVVLGTLLYAALSGGLGGVAFSVGEDARSQTRSIIPNRDAKWGEFLSESSHISLVPQTVVSSELPNPVTAPLTPTQPTSSSAETDALLDSLQNGALSLDGLFGRGPSRSFAPFAPGVLRSGSPGTHGDGAGNSDSVGGGSGTGMGSGLPGGGGFGDNDPVPGSGFGNPGDGDGYPGPYSPGSGTGGYGPNGGGNGNAAGGGASLSPPSGGGTPPNPPSGVSLPSVTVIASDAQASENGDSGSFTILRVGSTDSPLTVLYSISGSANFGNDYQPLTGLAIIPAGEDSVQVSVLPSEDLTRESTETLHLTILTSGQYLIGEEDDASLIIIDDDFGSQEDHGALTDRHNLEGEQVEFWAPPSLPGSIQFSATGLPFGVQIESTTGRIVGSIGYGTASVTPYPVRVTEDNGVDTISTDFNWTISRLDLHGIAGLCPSI